MYEVQRYMYNYNYGSNPAKDLSANATAKAQVSVLGGLSIFCLALL